MTKVSSWVPNTYNAATGIEELGGTKHISRRSKRALKSVEVPQIYWAKLELLVICYCNKLCINKPHQNILEELAHFEYCNKVPNLAQAANFEP